PEEVIGELIETAQRFGLSPFALARALVTVTAGGAHTAADADAVAAVHKCWGDLLDGRSTNR
ncbi:hypothetical protein C6A85_33795, partial [Mycobacterium sp. ITM-2017-0098]